MIVDMPYQYLAELMLTRCRKSKMATIIETTAVDIPEISETEAPVVCYTSGEFLESGQVSKKNASIDLYRLHDNKLYRNVANNSINHRAYEIKNTDFLLNEDTMREKYNNKICFHNSVNRSHLMQSIQKALENAEKIDIKNGANYSQFFYWINQIYPIGEQLKNNTTEIKSFSLPENVKEIMSSDKEHVLNNLKGYVLIDDILYREAVPPRFELSISKSITLSPPMLSLVVKAYPNDKNNPYIAFNDMDKAWRFYELYSDAASQRPCFPLWSLGINNEQMFPDESHQFFRCIVSGMEKMLSLLSVTEQEKYQDFKKLCEELLTHNEITQDEMKILADIWRQNNTKTLNGLGLLCDAAILADEQVNHERIINGGKANFINFNGVQKISPRQTLKPNMF